MFILSLTMLPENLRALPELYATCPGYFNSGNLRAL
jgi:hypothetical protein